MWCCYFRNFCFPIYSENGQFFRVSILKIGLKNTLVNFVKFVALMKICKKWNGMINMQIFLIKASGRNIEWNINEYYLINIVYYGIKVGTLIKVGVQ